jgi:RNA polymerase sigma-70 factor (ECF subfamily)
MTNYNSQKWDEWIRAVLKGDQNAYCLLLTSLRLWLMSYFTKRVHSNVVEDLIQDTLLTLHAKRQTFDPRYSFGPWIAAVARHRWIDHMRATLKYIETQLEDDYPSQETERDICAKHDVKILLKLIAPPHAEVIELVKLKEFSIEEVSKQTGHSPSSVKVMVHRGMKKMMAAVEKVRDD